MPRIHERDPADHVTKALADLARPIRWVVIVHHLRAPLSVDQRRAELLDVFGIDVSPRLYWTLYTQGMYFIDGRLSADGLLDPR